MQLEQVGPQLWRIPRDEGRGMRVPGLVVAGRHLIAWIRSDPSLAQLANIDSEGRLAGADPDRVSTRARERGRRQLGTLGSGNHFLEVQVVDEVYDARAAQRLGLAAGQVTLMIHTGSRGLGHQVCTD